MLRGKEVIDTATNHSLEPGKRSPLGVAVVDQVT